MYVGATKPGWHAFAGGSMSVVDLELAVAPVGPHDGNVGRAADAPGGPKV